MNNKGMNNWKDSTLPTSGHPQELSEKLGAFFVDRIAKIKESLAIGQSEDEESPPLLSMLEPSYH